MTNSYAEKGEVGSPDRDKQEENYRLEEKKEEWEKNVGRAWSKKAGRQTLRHRRKVISPEAKGR